MQDSSFVCSVLKFFAWLMIICGIIAGIDLFSDLGIIGLVPIIGGIIIGTLFFALAEIISYFDIINSNLFWLTQNLETKKDKTAEEE